MKKKIIIAVLALSLGSSLAYAGVKDVWQNNGGSYGASCSNGATKTITTDNGMICTHNGHTSKCSRDWSIKQAAVWACTIKKSQQTQKKKTFQLSGDHNVLACIAKKDALPAELALALGKIPKVKKYINKGACFLLTGDKRPKFEILNIYKEKMNKKSFVIYHVTNIEYAGQKAPDNANFYIADFIDRISSLIH